MARTWLQGILLCFFPLVLLPGCQHLPGLGASGGDEVRTRAVAASMAGSDAADPAHPLPERKVVSTAFAQESIVRTETKKQANPAPDVVRGLLGGLADPPSPGKSVDLPPLPKLENARPANEVNKPLDAGSPGVVTPEKNRQPMSPNSASPQVSPPPMVPQLPQAPMQDNKKPEARKYAPFLKALDCMLAERHQEAIQHLREYDQETEEFFLRLAPTLIMLVKKPIDELSPPEVAVLSDQLSSILAMLRPRSELRINKMCYCRRIHTFASVDSLPDNHAFLAGSVDRPGELVQLYAELKNFASEPTPEGDFLTKLACTLELRDTAGKKVWDYTYERRATTHRRQARLNDFYSNFSFYVPALAPGAYQLTIQIADETNPELHRIARKSMDFRVTPVGGQSSLR